MTDDATILAEVRRVAAELGVPVLQLTRSQYAQHSAMGKTGVKRIGWSNLRAMAAASQAVDVSGLDWDDEESDTDPAHDGWQPVVPEGFTVTGVSTMTTHPKTGKPQWVKAYREQESKLQQLERLCARLPDVPARVDPAPEPLHELSSDLLAVYPMGDPHLGLLSWAPETGESWDLEKGAAIIREAFDALTVERPAAERALVCQLGDFFHSDLSDNRTQRAGHALDVDGRWAKILDVGLDVMVHAIDRALVTHKHVDVVNLIGNHDDHSSVYLSRILAAWYRNEPRVSVDLSPAMHRYRRFGRNLLGMTHGHSHKHNTLEAIMASDQPEDWGSTEHRLWLVGHVHHTRRVEHRGCVVETFRTLTPRDAWAQGAGYRGGRDMTRIVLHRDHGEISRAAVSASYLAARMAGAA